MKWDKLGLIFSPDGQWPWMKSHATSPFVLHLSGSIYRIYFSSRDDLERSHIVFIEIDIHYPKDILRISNKPALGLGPDGFFDDGGVYAKCAVASGDSIRLYYLGWNAGLRPPMFYCSIGMAISHDGGETFVRHSPAPIIERSPVDPWCVLLPFVARENDRWRMWYGSGMGWREVGGHLQSIYDIKYAESDDGLNWIRDGQVCVPLANGESNVAHPYVQRGSAGYEMWYSWNNGEGYRIGWAESANGIDWRRRDGEVGIDVSEHGWDSEMICHPCVFSHAGRRYMIYSGNGFGRDGIGLAVAAD